jgi:hypothetical protein
MYVPPQAVRDTDDPNNWKCRQCNDTHTLREAAGHILQCTAAAAVNTRRRLSISTVWDTEAKLSRYCDWFFSTTDAAQLDVVNLTQEATTP